MALFDFLFGKKGGFEQTPTMNPQQQQLLQQLLGGLGGATGAGMGFLQNLLSGDTSKFEAPLMRQFNEQTIPHLAEQFSGANAQGSSAFGQALGSAGAGLAQDLGALRGGLQMQGLGQLSNFLNQGLGAKSFESIYRPGTSGFMGGLAPALGQGLGMGLSGGMSGGMGGLLSMLQGLLRSGGKGLRSGEMYSPKTGYQLAD